MMRGDLSDTAMLLAAGKGERLRPLTLMKPKPLFDVAGKTMLDHAIDRLFAAGIKKIIVNGWYMADAIERHLRDRCDPRLIFSRETELLDTGGGIKNVLSAFQGKPFICINADLYVQDEGVASLDRLATQWDASRMDALLLVQPTKEAFGFGQGGDFNLYRDGRLRRRPSAPPRSHVWIGTQIVKASLYENIETKRFSNGLILDKAEAAGRLYGCAHKGTCYHLGTQEDWAMTNRLLDPAAQRSGG